MDSPWHFGYALCLLGRQHEVPAAFLPEQQSCREPPWELANFSPWVIKRPGNIFTGSGKPDALFLLSTCRSSSENQQRSE